MKKLILLISSIAMSASLFGQAAQPAPYTKIQLFSNSGVPLAGGQVFSYRAGTSTPLATYTDSTASVQNTNPLILDSAGRGAVWLAVNVGYKLVLEDATGVVIWTQDNLVVEVPNSGVWTISGNNIFNNNTGFVGVGCGSSATVAKLDVCGSSNGANYLIRIDDAASSPGVNFYGNGIKLGSIAGDTSASFRVRSGNDASQLVVTQGNVTVQDQTLSIGTSTLSVRAGSGQGSNNLLQVQNNSGSNLAYFDSLGRLAAPVFNGTGDGAGFTFQNFNSTFIVDTLGDVSLSGTLALNGITGSTQCLQVNSSGQVSGSGTTCGGGGGGGVTAIVAGTNVTISPSSGLGSVTINSNGACATCVLTTGTQTITGTKTFSANQVLGNNKILQSVDLGSAIIGVFDFDNFENVNIGAQNVVSSGSGNGNLYFWAYGNKYLALNNSPIELAPLTNSQVSLGDATHAFLTSYTEQATLQGLGGIKAQLSIQSQDNTINYINIRAGATVASTYELDLPNNPGTNGYVLATDGTGVTSWIPNGAGTGITQLHGDAAAGPGSGNQAVTLATVNGNVGSFTNANITVNAKGLITAAANGSSSGGITTINPGSQTGPTITFDNTTNQVTVANNSANHYNFSLPQQIGTASSVTFGAVTTGAGGTFTSGATGSTPAFQTTGGTNLHLDGNGNGFFNGTVTVGGIVSIAGTSYCPACNSQFSSVNLTNDLIINGSPSINSSNQFIGSGGINTSGSVLATGLLISGGGVITGLLQVTNNVQAVSFEAGTSPGVSCSGSPTSSFASVNGIVTHC